MNHFKDSKVKSVEWLWAVKQRRIYLLKEGMILKLKGRDKMRWRVRYEAKEWNSVLLGHEGEKLSKSLNARGT
jgi:hypothetical protein